MRRHITAAAAGLVLLAVMMALSFAVSGEREKNPGQTQIVEDAVAAIAPSIAGGKCPDTTRLMPINTIRIADALVRASKRTPAAAVPAPSGEGEVELGAVPGLLADELKICIDSGSHVGPGWERLVARLRS